MKFHILLLFGAMLLPLSSCTSKDNLTDFPSYADPYTIGRKLTRVFIKEPFSQYGSPLRVSEPRTQVTYPDVMAWVGGLWLAQTIGDQTLAQDLIAKMDPLFGDKAYLLPKADHVDNSVFGAVPLEIYMHNGISKYLDLGESYADAQWDISFRENPSPDEIYWADLGYSWQTRLWLDDTFMITLLQSQAAKALKDTIYIERAAKEMVMYLDSLPRPSGLFDHGPESPFAWGRGNGWMALGMTEVLRNLSCSSEYYKAIMDKYLIMMSTLLSCQGEKGMWRQIVDDETMWEESSSTAMFTYAFIVGVKSGWLKDKAYAIAARKAWLALCKLIDEDGHVKKVCEGTMLGFDSEHYRQRLQLTGDVHGQAPIIWCANALMNSYSSTDQEMKYIEGSNLTLVGKVFEDTPNPYHRINTERYSGFDPVEFDQVHMSAGIAVAFKTDSPRITVIPEYNEIFESWTTGPLSASGFDLYSKEGKSWTWSGCAVISTSGKEREAMNARRTGMTEYLLYLPLYADLKSVRIGVRENSVIEAIDNPFKSRIAVFGSSFTQGTSTSRPGMTYPSQLSRMTGYQFLNLGMAGHCLMQDYFAVPLSEAKVDAFLFDTFSNPDAPVIEERLFLFIEKLQTSHPGVPLIFQKTIDIGYLNFDTARQMREKRKQDTVDRLMGEACKKYNDVYYIKSNKANGKHYETTVDGVHPDDYGYYLWAKSIAGPLTKILRKY
ncbi:MAG: glycoside hydrolase family 88 protein [Candidatus Cryptobacteroides sp.]|jgi:unsaturated rhamnogalacturonyl hydrolase